MMEDWPIDSTGCVDCGTLKRRSSEHPLFCEDCVRKALGAEEPSMFDPLHTRLLVFEARLDRFEKQLTALTYLEEWRAWVDKQLKELLR